MTRWITSAPPCRRFGARPGLILWGRGVWTIKTPSDTPTGLADILPGSGEIQDDYEFAKQTFKVD